MYSAHLERSPQQQAGDIQSTDQYVKTHSVLIEMMVDPAVQATYQISDGTPKPFVQHLYRAHLERSPQQQAGDIQGADQYVKTHSALLEMMAEPVLAALTGTC